MTFTMFFGAANGSAQKALRRLSEPNVMLSATTQNNRPWPCENLFVDCGAYSCIVNGDPLPAAEEYTEYCLDNEAELATLRDRPCEPSVLEQSGNTLTEQQTASVNSQLETLAAFERYGLDVEPVAVVQGWDTHDYLRNIDELRDHGLLTEKVGIGSVCRRGSQNDVRAILHAVCDEIGEDRCHAFGVKTNALTPALCRRLDSADTTAYDYKSRRGNLSGWRASAKGYLEVKNEIASLTSADAVATLDQYC